MTYGLEPKSVWSWLVLAVLGTIACGAAVAQSLEELERELERRKAAEIEQQRQADARRRAAAERGRAEQRAAELIGPMVSLPAGAFLMGDISGVGHKSERPLRNVSVKAFRMGKFEVTVGEFRRFAQATGHIAAGCEGVPNFSLRKYEDRPDRGWGDPGVPQNDLHPVTCVNWDDVQAYLSWIRTETRVNVRLPSEAEWEYAARAGTASMYPWGDDEQVACVYGNVADQTPWPGEQRAVRGAWAFKCNDRFFFTAPVGSYRSTGFGLHDLIGNVWEWTDDCWNDDHVGGPTDGFARKDGDCSRRAARGGAWFSPVNLRVSSREGFPVSTRRARIGFRLVADP